MPPRKKPNLTVQKAKIVCTVTWWLIDSLSLRSLGVRVLKCDENKAVDKMTVTVGNVRQHTLTFI